MIFNNVDDVREYLVSTYPKAKGNTMACWITTEVSMAIGVYEGEDLIQGIMAYKDINRGKWILLDSLHADLAVRNYIEYRQEFDDAIALFELLETVEEEEKFEEDLFFDLD